MITLSIEKNQGNSIEQHELEELRTSIKALIYARVSTDDQARHGYSLESQVERCREKLIKDYSVRDEEIIALVEMGEMGDDPRRPALLYGKWLIQQGVGQKFAVLHPDRLARNFRQQVEFIEDELLENGIELVSVEVPYDPDNAESILFFQMQGAIAQYNKAKILANSKRGRRQKVKNGKIPGVRRVFGYIFDKDTDILVENSKERDVYLQMVNWLLYGKEGREMNFTSIARELSLLGIPAPNGDKWYQASVSRILKSPVYTGRFYYGKTEYRQNKGKTTIVKKPEAEWQMVKIPAYIDEDTYSLLVQKIGTLSYKNRGAKPKVTYLLKGLVRCGRCGGAVVAGAPSRNKKTKEIMYHYYVCSGKTRKVFEVGTGREVHQCKGRNWRQDVIDEYIWNYLKQILKNPEEVLQKVFEHQSDQSHVREMNNKKAKLENALNEKEAERKRWLKLNARGRISDKELDEEVIPLKHEIQRLNEELLLINETISSTERLAERLSSIKENIESFKMFINKDISDEDKKKYVNLLIKKVVLHDDEIEIYTSWDFEHGAYPSDYYTNNLIARQRDGRLQEPVHRYHCRL